MEVFEREQLMENRPMIVSNWIGTEELLGCIWRLLGPQRWC